MLVIERGAVKLAAVTTKVAKAEAKAEAALRRGSPAGKGRALDPKSPAKPGRAVAASFAPQAPFAALANAGGISMRIEWK